MRGAKTIRELKERLAQYEAIKKEGKLKMKQSKTEKKEENDPRRHEYDREETMF